MPLLPLLDETTPTSLDDNEGEDDGEEILALPSDFNAEELVAYDLNTLAVYELKLRVGLAFDLLQQVREAVKHSAAHVEQKTQDARTKRDHLKEQTKINASRDRSKFEARRYNHNFSRLQTLRLLLQTPPPADTMEANLRRIDLNNDLKMVSLLANRTAGDSKRLANMSWIWSSEVSEEGAQWATKGTEHMLASDCAHWHRTRMQKTQADTFVNYTCGDFRHAYAGYDTLRNCWLEVAQREGIAPGARAYAHQQAAMYATMRDEIRLAFDKVRKPGVDREQMDHTMVGAPGSCSVKLST
ncbi:hypothetical protein K466DRAFT_505751 [Polyporus arcularius HHB13444]|uniref:Uncharacterized protein n=1 Tax=Polyporus arcularius HHB13444 TaxID=1314778 RepID=A0A5C3NPU5_9APHY|nr:hypothetical protein K466DRAFT_505751 [Polyporus arcularius HHB13444]